jgi:signal transduction histidine kinase
VLDFSRLQSGVQALEQIDFNLRDVVEHALDAVAAKGQQKGLVRVLPLQVSGRRC